MTHMLTKEALVWMFEHVNKALFSEGELFRFSGTQFESLGHDGDWYVASFAGVGASKWRYATVEDFARVANEQFLEAIYK